jgi:hypothetical protein
MNELREVEQNIFSNARADYASLDHAQRIVYLVACYVAAVNNGGHASFFYNSPGELASETVEALLETGVASQAKLLQQCIRQFPRSFVPSGIDERNVAFNSLPDRAHNIMEICDRKFYLESKDERDKRVLAFWNRSQSKV